MAKLYGVGRLAKIRRLKSRKDLAEGTAALIAADKSFKKIAKLDGELVPGKENEGFEALLEIVVSQQLSSAAADTIFARVKACVVPFDPPTLLSTSEETLRAAGLSRPKQKHMKSIAARIVSGELDLARVAALADDEAHAHLIETSGIGPWTAQVYLMTSLLRADVWPAGDVALQAAVTRALGLRRRPKLKAMIALGERYRPWRSVAARLFWSHYRAMRLAEKEKALKEAAKKAAARAKTKKMNGVAVKTAKRRAR